MLSPTDVKVNGKKFQLLPLPLFTSMKMDKKITTTLIPLAGSFSNLKNGILGADLDLDKIADIAQKSLNSLPENELTDLIETMFSTVTYVPDKGAPALLDCESAIQSAFQGDIMGVYELLFHIAKYNKFTPFALVGIGSKIQTMLA